MNRSLICVNLRHLRIRSPRSRAARTTVARVAARSRPPWPSFPPEETTARPRPPESRRTSAAAPVAIASVFVRVIRASSCAPHVSTEHERGRVVRDACRVASAVCFCTPAVCHRTPAPFRRAQGCGSLHTRRVSLRTVCVSLRARRVSLRAGCVALRARRVALTHGPCVAAHRLCVVARRECCIATRCVCRCAQAV
jgi:hypothetical protein